MNDDKNNNATEQSEVKADEQRLNIDDLFKKEDDKKLAQEDIESEQAFKETQTERD